MNVGRYNNKTRIIRRQVHFKTNFLEMLVTSYKDPNKANLQYLLKKPKKNPFNFLKRLKNIPS